MVKKIKNILLTQPNYAWLSKRTWRFPPYTLCLLKAALEDRYNTLVFDPNFRNLSVDETVQTLKQFKPDLIGVSSASTEYYSVAQRMIAILRKSFPDAIIVFGGVIPTVMIEETMKDDDIDYWIMGEGEYSFPTLIDRLQEVPQDLKDISGLAYMINGKPNVNSMSFIDDLDKLKSPDYSNIYGATLHDYGNIEFKYSPGLIARKYPFAITTTSRGCPYKCVFCAAKSVSGDQVRYRSAESVLAEIDELYGNGIREIIFLDDHFLAKKDRALKIMQGIIDRNYDMTWKCVNVTAWLLSEEVLRLMYKSGCSFITVSIESGNQYVLDHIIKKPVKLGRIPKILQTAKSIGFDVAANFVIGFPGEKWDQILDTCRFADKINVDIVNFHIATPLPKTELMEMSLKEGLLPDDYLENISVYSGYGKGLISTDEFTSTELEVVRSFEWDRINFSSPEKRETVARMNGISMQELEEWRRNTRRNLGVNSKIKNLISSHNQSK